MGTCTCNNSAVSEYKRLRPHAVHLYIFSYSMHSIGTVHGVHTEKYTTHAQK